MIGMWIAGLFYGMSIGLNIAPWVQAQSKSQKK